MQVMFKEIPFITTFNIILDTVMFRFNDCFIRIFHSDTK